MAESIKCRKFNQELLFSFGYDVVAKQHQTKGGVELLAQINLTLKTEVLHSLFSKDGKDDAFAKLPETIYTLKWTYRLILT